MTLDAYAIAAAIVAQLQTAWNAGDGHAYGAPFAEEADYISVLGRKLHSRRAIAAAHEGVLKSLYKDSTMRHTVTQARALTDDVIVAYVDTVLNVPAGHITGEHNAILALILVREEDAWRIAHLQNTLVVPH